MVTQDFGHMYQLNYNICNNNHYKMQTFGTPEGAWHFYIISHKESFSICPFWNKVGCTEKIRKIIKNVIVIYNQIYSKGMLKNDNFVLTLWWRAWAYLYVVSFIGILLHLTHLSLSGSNRSTQYPVMGAATIVIWLTPCEGQCIFSDVRRF